MNVLDIRGTNGSGKSHIVHELLRLDHEVLEEEETIGYYIPSLDLHIVGRYDTACGGCDGIATQDEVCNRVRRFVVGNVLLEGLLVSHTFSRWNELALELEQQGHVYTFAFLDTPEQVCIDRVLQRRKARGNHKPYDPKNLTKDWYQDRRVAEKLIEAGRHVIWLNYETAVEDVRRMLNGNR